VRIVVSQGVWSVEMKSAKAIDQVRDVASTMKRFYGNALMRITE